jgi:hypothetical protein
MVKNDQKVTLINDKIGGLKIDQNLSKIGGEN